MASDLNSEFLNVYNNGETLGWPATTSKDLNAQEFILDAYGDTSITADTDDRIDFRFVGTDVFQMTRTGFQSTSGNRMKIDGVSVAHAILDLQANFRLATVEARVAEAESHAITVAAMAI